MRNQYQLFLNTIFLVALIALFYLHFSAKQKIVYVNTNKLLAEYQGMKDTQAEFEEKAKSWQSNVDTLGSELETKIKQFQQQKTSMSEKEVKLNEELLHTKQQQFVQYREAIQQKAAEEDGKLKEKILAEVNAYIKDYGQQHGYTMIMGATTMGNIVYAEEVIDITNELVKGLNQTYIKK